MKPTPLLFRALRTPKRISLRRFTLLSMAVMAACLGLVITLHGRGAGAVAPQTREFTLVAQETDWQLQPGTTVKAWTYNGQMPGSEIRVREGDHLKITLVNKLPVATTIHWHGVDVPNAMDGPAGLNQAPVEPGQSFVYTFDAAPVGTRWYHSHTDVGTQVMMGLYGAFIIEPRHPKRSYDRDDTILLSEWDADLTPGVATGAAPRSARDQSLPGGQFGTDFFLMNGRMHEAIPPIVVAEGDRVLLRLINAGTMAHPFHIHGHQFKIVATDGNPVPKAAQLTKDTVLIAPGERYDLEFEANNPGVWMVHCHIENHADNGMMTVIQYEGYLPTGPLADSWNRGMPGMDQSSHDAGSSDEATPVLTVAPADTSATPETTAVASPKDGTLVGLVDNRFAERTITVKAGTTVVWENDGGNWHSVASADAGFNSTSVKPGQTFSHRFDTPGTYHVMCTLHARQGMSSTVIVTP